MLVSRFILLQSFNYTPFLFCKKTLQIRDHFFLVMHPELEFLKSLWGKGTEEEEGYRTGPPGYKGWRNSFLGIDSWAQ
jgi:hypothetical protein